MPRTRRVRLRRLGPASLTARLAATVVVLVALVSVVISALTTAAISDHLTDELDQKLTQAHGRGLGALGEGRPPRRGPGDGGPANGDEGPGGGPEVRGQDAGTLSALTALSAGGASSGWVIEESGALRGLSDDDLAALEGLSPDDDPRTVSLPDSGDYRVLVSDVSGVAVTTGLPTDSVAGTVRSLVGWEVLFSLLGVAVAGGVAVAVVRRQLRPLSEVAATARRVSETDLATGEIGVTARVPARLVDSGTEVGEVATAFNTMLGHVEQALTQRQRSEQQVRQFVADASHELRTPLATITGYAELSLRDRDPDALAQAMTKVRAEAARMTSLVEDLLLLARLDAGRPLARTEVDVTRLVLECVEDARVTGTDHRWLLELPEEAVSVTGDELRLHQVVTNLLTNATRHTPPGTTVVSAVERRPGAVLVTVTDDGPGIDPALLPDVFRRFTRGDAARSREASGAGLGLALSRAIARAHDGDLTVTSEPGRTRFVLSLPV